MTNQETKIVEEQTENKEKKKSIRGKGRDYPLMTLDSSLEVAKIVDELKRATRSDIEKGIGKKGGGLTKRIAAARQWSLTQGVGEMKMTDISMDILHPEKDEDIGKAKRQAYFNIPLFRELYDEYGWELPRKDLLVNKLVRMGVKKKDALTIVNIISHSKDTIFNNESILPLEKKKIIPAEKRNISKNAQEFKEDINEGKRLTENLFDLILNLGYLKEGVKNFEKTDMENRINTLKKLISNYPLIDIQLELFKSDISLLDIETLKKIMPKRIEALIKMVMHNLGIINNHTGSAAEEPKHNLSSEETSDSSEVAD